MKIRITSSDIPKFTLLADPENTTGKIYPCPANFEHDVDYPR